MSGGRLGALGLGLALACAAPGPSEAPRAAEPPDSRVDERDPVSPDGGAPPLTREEVRLVVRAKLADVRACFDAGLADDPELGGRLRVRFTITPEGRAVDAEIVEDELAPSPVGACIVERLASWQFPRPRDGRALRVAYPFVFTAEEALRAAGLPRVEGTVSPSEVGAVFEARRDELDACVTGLGDAEPIHGTLGVAFTIDEGGQVAAIARYLDELPEAASACILHAISTWSFPPAAAGDEARVNHDLSW